MYRCNEQEHREMDPPGECQALRTQTRKGEALKPGALDLSIRVAATGNTGNQGLSSFGEHG